MSVGSSGAFPTFRLAKYRPEIRSPHDKKGSREMVEQDPRRRRRRAAAMRREEAEWASKSGPVTVVKPASSRREEALREIEVERIPSVLERAAQMPPSRPPTKGQLREIERLRKALGLPLGDPVPESFVGAQALVKRLFAQKAEGKSKKPRRVRPRPAGAFSLDRDGKPLARFVSRDDCFLVETHPENTPSDLSEPVEVVQRNGTVSLVWLVRPCGFGDTGTLWRFANRAPRRVARAA